MTKWTLERLKGAAIAPLKAAYEAMPTTPQGQADKARHPELFSFDAVSVGDVDGQAFFVPLDESSRETAEFILKAIAAYRENRVSPWEKALKVYDPTQHTKEGVIVMVEQWNLSTGSAIEVLFDDDHYTVVLTGACECKEILISAINYNTPLGIRACFKEDSTTG